MSKGNPQTVIRWNPEDLRKLRAIAASEGISFAELVRKEVLKLLENRK